MTPALGQGKEDRAECDRHILPGALYAFTEFEFVCSRCNALFCTLKATERAKLINALRNSTVPSASAKQELVSAASRWYDQWIRNSSAAHPRNKLTKTDFMSMVNTSNGQCALIGVHGTFYLNSSRSHFNALSIDRIDSSKTYLPGNVQICLLSANFAKNDLSQTVSKKYFEALVKHQSSIRETISLDDVIPTTRIDEHFEALGDDLDDENNDDGDDAMLYEDQGVFGDDAIIAE